ncbi:hypothetical protein Purlil1_3007 [Purpureocillium lilacinum]|uniref:Uncharacterized protein n=1 Tax=Purpureocillium lilacinum TaxID=33203 RepID=A0ABR0C8T8_PURLI|nr:hypothetical protein Purlil1_3007 [Purpureocillium lilacinum]
MTHDVSGSYRRSRFGSSRLASSRLVSFARLEQSMNGGKLRMQSQGAGALSRRSSRLRRALLGFGRLLHSAPWLHSPLVLVVIRDLAAVRVLAPCSALDVTVCRRATARSSPCISGCWSRGGDQTSAGGQQCSAPARAGGDGAESEQSSMSLFPEEEERIRGREQGEGVEEARRPYSYEDGNTPGTAGWAVSAPRRSTHTSLPLPPRTLQRVVTLTLGPDGGQIVRKAEPDAWVTWRGRGVGWAVPSSQGSRLQAGWRQKEGKSVGDSSLDKAGATLEQGMRRACAEHVQSTRLVREKSAGGGPPVPGIQHDLDLYYLLVPSLSRGPAPANRPASNPVRQRNPHKPLNVADKPNLHGTIHRVVSRWSRAVSCLAAGGRPSVSARAPKSPAHRRVHHRNYGAKESMPFAAPPNSLPPPPLAPQVSLRPGPARPDAARSARPAAQWRRGLPCQAQATPAGDCPRWAGRPGPPWETLWENTDKNGLMVFAFIFLPSP